MVDVWLMVAIIIATVSLCVNAAQFIWIFTREGLFRFLYGLAKDCGQALFEVQSALVSLQGRIDSESGIDRDLKADIQNAIEASERRLTLYLSHVSNCLNSHGMSVNFNHSQLDGTQIGEGNSQRK